MFFGILTGSSRIPTSRNSVNANARTPSELRTPDRTKLMLRWSAGPNGHPVSTWSVGDGRKKAV